MFQTQLTISTNNVLHYWDQLDQCPLIVSSHAFETPENPTIWTLTLFSHEKLSIQILLPYLDQLSHFRHINSDNHGLEKLKFTSISLESKDWVTESQKQFTAIDAGHICIYPEWDIPSHKKKNTHYIQITPSRAFGTGSHATTKGCLETLSLLFDKAVTPHHVLDMGTGSGILALAAHALWPHASITAADNDPEAIEICDLNRTINQAHFHSYIAESYHDSSLQKHAPYDLIIANILSEPLIQLSEHIASIIDPTKPTYLILSGFYEYQSPDIIAAYKPLFPKIYHQQTTQLWQTLCLASS